MVDQALSAKERGRNRVVADGRENRATEASEERDDVVLRESGALGPARTFCVEQMSEQRKAQGRGDVRSGWALVLAAPAGNALETRWESSSVLEARIRANISAAIIEPLFRQGRTSGDSGCGL